MKRLSIRLRITLAFTFAMALVLTAFGTFLFVETRSQLDESIHDSLEQRAADVATTVEFNDDEGGAIAFQDLDPEDSFAQVIGPDGEIEFTTDQVGDAPVATAIGVSDLDEVTGIDGRVRVLVTDIGGGRNAIVGATLEDRDESVKNLALLLAIGGPASLLLAGFGGWWVAGRALAPLERGYERERRFVDDASHELRTPLALHKAELEVALRYGENEATLRAAIESGIEEVDRLAQLADDLLVVARSGEDGLSLRLENVDVADLGETLATRFQARLESSRRSLELEVEPGLRVRADRLRLEQAVTNLLENAIRHGAGQILLLAESAGERVRISVKDEGAGFDDDLAERAFERFTRGDAARGRGGAGLGLPIVETIADAHGGKAGISSRTGNGADVWIELPRAR